jgi:hypothetical protein
VEVGEVQRGPPIYPLNVEADRVRINSDAGVISGDSKTKAWEFVPGTNKIGGKKKGPVPGAVMVGVERRGLVSSMVIVPANLPGKIPVSVAVTLKVMTVSAEQVPAAAKSQGMARARAMVGTLMVVTPLNDRRTLQVRSIS